MLYWQKTNWVSYFLYIAFIKEGVSFVLEVVDTSRNREKNFLIEEDDIAIKGMKIRVTTESKQTREKKIEINTTGAIGVVWCASRLVLATACADSSNWVARVEVIIWRCLSIPHSCLLTTEQTKGGSDGRDNQVFILT